MAAMANIELELSPELKAAFEELGELIKGFREELKARPATQVHHHSNQQAQCRCPAQLHTRYKGPAYNA